MPFAPGPDAGGPRDPGTAFVAFFHDLGEATEPAGAGSRGRDGRGDHGVAGRG